MEVRRAAGRGDAMPQLDDRRYPNLPDSIMDNMVYFVKGFID